MGVGAVNKFAARSESSPYLIHGEVGRALRREPRSPVQDGSVLILALWVLFFLAALALAVGAHVSAGLKLAGFMHDDVHGYHLARAGVTHAALQVACNTNRWDAWGEGAWNADPQVFSDQVVDENGTFSIVSVNRTADGTVTNVGLVGAESRLNLNVSPVMKSVFEQFMIQVGGTSAGQAETLYEFLRAYREAKQQHLLTVRAERGYGEPDSGGMAPLDSIHEFLLVEGVDDGVFALIEPYVTVYGSGAINANTASTELLLSCAAAYPEHRATIDRIIEKRGGAPLEKSDLSPFGFLRLYSTAFYGMAVGHTATGAEAARIEFVVDKSGQRQYWHEF